jgi:hypothetical protein
MVVRAFAPLNGLPRTSGKNGNGFESLTAASSVMMPPSSVAEKVWTIAISGPWIHTASLALPVRGNTPI